MGKSESQMDIMEKSTKPRKHRWTVVEIGLSVTVLLLSCALAGLIVLYTSADRNICTTPQCVTAAARLLQNMDPSMEPCQDFYQYACGGWIERHVIPETSSLHSVFNILRDELEIVLKGVLEMESKDDREAFKKAKTLYSSCMNEILIEQRDSQPLLRLIDSIGDWPVASEVWNGTAEQAWSLEDTLAVLNARYNKKAVLEMFVWPDDRDSRRYIIHVDQPALGMPSRDYYLSDGNYKKVREAYLEFMVSIARIAREDRNLTQDEERLWEDMTQVLELETDIANATSPAEERNDITVLYNKMTLTEVQQTFNLNGFNWTRYVQGIMSSVSVTVQPDEPIVVYCSPYLEKLRDVLSKHSHSLVSSQTYRNNILYYTTIKKKRKIIKYNECTLLYGITTLGENIADNGGVRQAYKAYMKWVEREGEEPRLPGLEMDHKQLFFLNFAQVWCGACRPEYAIQSIKTDPHSPLEYRVLGSLQNFEAFSEAFHCARGTPMNPEEKCRVW
uniref:Membrane metallo-endopeptidase-like 1 n=1 Tax=Cyprinus carpio TaxID=7962 RepID=A0A8C2IHK4_CYPCA